MRLVPVAAHAHFGQQGRAQVGHAGHDAGISAPAQPVHLASGSSNTSSSLFTYKIG